MHNLNVNGYSEQDVINQLHLVQGAREVKFRYDLLNKYNIKIGELESNSSGNITFNADAEIKRIAKFNFKDNEIEDINWLNDRVQPFFMLKMPDGNYAEWSLGIFLMSSPTKLEKNKKIYREIEAYDESQILKDDCIDTRFRIISSTNYITAITSILNSAGISKVNIPYIAGTITTDKEFEIGTSKLKIVNQLLAEINYTSIWVDNGYFTAQPYVLPNLREYDYIYKTDKNSIIFEGSSVENDLFSMPNKWIAYTSTPEKISLISTYINDNPSSATSTINRGRNIVRTIPCNDILDQTTLDAYVKKVAYEDSQAFEKFIFMSALVPMHKYQDCLYIEHGNLGTASKYIEYSWQLDFNSKQMTHNCRRVINI